VATTGNFQQLSGTTPAPVFSVRIDREMSFNPTEQGREQSSGKAKTPRLLTAGLLVRVQPLEPFFYPCKVKGVAFHRLRPTTAQL